MDLIQRDPNPRKQGDAGLGIAIAWFATNGYTVNIPLTDSQPYDLIVGDGTSLLRVSVKTTTQLKKGVYEAGLRTQGGNKSQFTIRPFDPSAVDLLFIVCGDGARFLIPSASVVGRASICLGKKYQAFKV